MGFRAPVAFLRRSPRAVNAIAVGNGEARIRTMDSPRRPAAGARARDAAYCSSIGFRRFALNSLSVIQPFLPHLFQLARRSIVLPEALSCTDLVAGSGCLDLKALRPRPAAFGGSTSRFRSRLAPARRRG